MTFGDALSLLKCGEIVNRSGWNGKGMFLYYVPANDYPSITDAAKKHFGDTVPYRDYIAIRSVNGEVVPWVASQSDILANDWSLL